MLATRPELSDQTHFLEVNATRARVFVAVLEHKKPGNGCED